MAKLGYSLDHTKINLSHSIRESFHKCPRYYQITVENNHGRTSARKSLIFAFGHSVAAGVQSLVSGKTLEESIMHALAAYDIDDLFEDYRGRNFGKVILALQLFERQVKFLSDWEVAWFIDADGNKRSGVEFDFLIELTNDGTYQGHIDVVMYNRELNQFMILELKTAATYYETTYRNSTQALGYSLVLDYILDAMKESLQLDAEAIASAKSMNQVLYYIFDIGEEAWVDLNLRQTSLAKSDFLLDVDTDVMLIKHYRTIKLFPKRGSNCRKYNSECEFFTTCDFNSLVYEQAPKSKSQFETNAKPAIHIKLEELIQQQMERARQDFYKTTDAAGIPDIDIGDGIEAGNLRRDDEHFAM